MTAPEATSEELRVASTAEITAYLQQLQREGAGLLLAGPQGQSLSSHIVALDADADLIGLKIGTDPEGISQALVVQGEITAVAYLGTIKLQFEIEAPVLVSGEQGTVLRGTLPTRLYRFQRRQSFRVRPNTRTPQVRWADANASASDAPLRARIADLSLGGLALQLPAEAVLPWVPGQLLKATQVELDRDTRFDADLRVQHLGEATPEGRLVGLAFADLDAEAQRMLQRYIEQTQKFSRMLNRARDT